MGGRGPRENFFFSPIGGFCVLAGLIVHSRAIENPQKLRVSEMVVSEPDFFCSSRKPHLDGISHYFSSTTHDSPVFRFAKLVRSSGRTYPTQG